MYDRRHFRVTLEGTNATDEDIWTTGWRIAPSLITEPTVDYPEMAGRLLGTVREAAETFWDTLKPLIGRATHMTSVKVAPVDVDGRYIEDLEAVVYDWETPLTGGPSAAVHPPQISVVASLTTGARRGKATHGRMYLPLTAVPIDSSDFTIAVANRKTVANAVVGLLNDSIGALADVSLDPVVMSNAGEGTTRTITDVAVGSIADTQRRRRNRFVEQYTIVSR